ncbi:MAG: hypothetical protein GY795_14560 [Desulfobacterales bacterium]|nr:hypothetical protein [Desulfobacterales bacterium]
MNDYAEREGKHRKIFQIAEGIRVFQTKYGSWELSLKYQGQRKRQTFIELEKLWKKSFMICILSHFKNSVRTW